MEPLKLKFTRLQNEIISFLMTNNGRSFNLRRIAKNLEVSLTAVRKALILLKELNYVEIKKDDQTNHLSISLIDNKQITRLKRAENLKQTYLSGLVDFLEEQFSGSTIILFGSYSRGEDTFSSDIDIAILKRKEKIIDLTIYEKYLNRDIQIQFYDSYNEINKNLKENLFNGIVLSGGIEL